MQKLGAWRTTKELSNQFGHGLIHSIIPYQCSPFNMLDSREPLPPVPLRAHPSLASLVLPRPFNFPHQASSRLHGRVEPRTSVNSPRTSFTKSYLSLPHASHSFSFILIPFSHKP
ncbi:hypothetical protein PTI98_011080 [Pleurotus ostreatus]|nr:hypothetical protein PTI98_011080 [Pleurotus ostreatus]